MCGINGLFRLDGGPIEDGAHWVAQMNQAVAHRGPDDAGVWTSDDGSVALGHRRLSILDLSTSGHQPMLSPTGSVIVFNGEVYNFRELRANLKGYPFQSNTDTEVLLASYESSQAASLDGLVGMFAFAIWDASEDELFLARDRIGNKPLYYCNSNGVFCFSSEPRSLLVLPWVRRNLDESALYSYLTFGFTPDEGTMFEGIRRLRPGYSLSVGRDGKVCPKEYWKPHQMDLADDEPSLHRQLVDGLHRSVRYRMVSDVPVGLFLSGGVDSSAIAASMRQQSDGEIHSFSISFAGQPGYDEADAARDTARRLGFKHHERVVTVDDMRSQIEQIVEVFDDPLADPTCIPIYFLSQLANESGVKVILTGDGPDELLLGYRGWQKYQTLYPYYRRFQQVPRVGRTLLRRLAAFRPTSHEILQRAERGQELFWGNTPSFAESVKRQILSNDYEQRSEGWDCHDTIEGYRSEYETFASMNNGCDVNWMSYLGLRFVIPHYYLHRADRLGMAHSVELRTPYLDHHFVNLCLSIPAKWKVQGGEPKAIFKRALESMLPRETLYAPKKGFCVPLGPWANDLMKDFLRVRLPDFCRATGLFNPTAVGRELARERPADLWNFYLLIHWFDRWLIQ